MYQSVARRIERFVNVNTENVNLINILTILFLRHVTSRFLSGPYVTRVNATPFLTHVYVVFMERIVCYTNRLMKQLSVHPQFQEKFHVINRRIARFSGHRQDHGNQMLQNVVVCSVHVNVWTNEILSFLTDLECSLLIDVNKDMRSMVRSSARSAAVLHVYLQTQEIPKFHKFAISYQHFLHLNETRTIEAYMQHHQLCVLQHQHQVARSVQEAQDLDFQMLRLGYDYKAHGMNLRNDTTTETEALRRTIFLTTHISRAHQLQVSQMLTSTIINELVEEVQPILQHTNRMIDVLVHNVHIHIHNHVLKRKLMELVVAHANIDTTLRKLLSIIRRDIVTQINYVYNEMRRSVLNMATLTYFKHYAFTETITRLHSRVQKKRTVQSIVVITEKTESNASGYELILQSGNLLFNTVTLATVIYTENQTWPWERQTVHQHSLYMSLLIHKHTIYIVHSLLPAQMHRLQALINNFPALLHKSGALTQKCALCHHRLVKSTIGRVCQRLLRAYKDL